MGAAARAAHQAPARLRPRGLARGMGRPVSPNAAGRQSQREKGPRRLAHLSPLVHYSAFGAQKFELRSLARTLWAMSALHLVAQSQTARNAPAPTRLAPLEPLVGRAAGAPRLSPSQAVHLGVDVAFALSRLLSGTELRLAVPFDADEEIWEIGLERSGEDVLVALYRPRPAPRVVVHDRVVPTTQLVAGVAAVLEQALSSRSVRTSERVSRDVERAAKALESLEIAGAPKADRVEVAIRGVVGREVFFEARCWQRRTELGGALRARVERSDLHALLCPGQLVLHANGAAIPVGNGHLFLDAEELMRFADRLVDPGRGHQGDLQARLSGVTLGYSPGAPGILTARRRRHGGVASLGGECLEIPAHGLCRAIAEFALALADTQARNDPSQEYNLRLTDLREAANKALEQSNPEEEALTNPVPDCYREFARKRHATGSGRWAHGGRMTFRSRWVATVPGLDLRATFLCGDRLVVDTSRETACLDRQTGQILWRCPSGPAACTVSPAGLVRLRADGLLSLVDLWSGKTRFSLQVKPRSGGGAAGSLVHSSGLPRLLVLTDGDRQISAVDVACGTVRWRHTTARPGNYRLRRLGRLLLTVGGNTQLLALDVSSGEAVWRQRSSAGVYTGAIAVDSRSAMVISESAGEYRLQHVDPWSGQLLWEAPLSEAPLARKHPVFTADAVVVPTGQNGNAGVEAFDRETGRLLWSHAEGLASSHSAWLGLDDGVLINDARGVLLSLDAHTGQPHFTHVFAGGVEGDAPRRLEPVLRNGALFVPQQSVHVVRPRTGEVIGTVPQELVPDLLRVDERCDVYIGEESGHLAAFSAEARLSLVR